MLSYRHAFHAGNHADVLKHAVQAFILESLCAKDKGYSYIDTHSGAGGYTLSHEWTQKKAEYLGGIAKLWNEQQKWPQLAGYFAAIKAMNQGDELEHYPGSPLVAAHFQRPQDKLTLMELHHNEVELLRHNLAGDGVAIHHRDGFEGLVGLLPPTPKRGLVLIDPPYELKEDYQRVASTLKKAHKRWPIGIYAVWYPLLAKAVDRSDGLKAALAKLGFEQVLCAELSVQAQADDFGMHGSGMIVLNPPWKLDEKLAELLPALSRTLAQDEQAGFSLEWLK
ncbi:23S rRNA (adenine(2030)-N(6))-methyltransferase RlmJ [Oceanimonas sp. CHS3-5]|uniref:23S rRNA (adenine(2030)-N(6))-methyltransferase RlmJ n=1 Tax=Oceanimonas sp. CHS3-5 TaxID=3068186 RepID=UPI0027401082|nr:23S rRNA (adenine(2030)-N(6))-methyltransferase RlmJ [Oceanimonas sp. CHS3-5]MDP5293480.1 23S rRNA (adenine(2030)-N(6))-methyltransferase RlmJ [Oceanimonas sp. CHS3-5]